jgi:hypothetical protein
VDGAGAEEWLQLGGRYVAGTESAGVTAVA